MPVHHHRFSAMASPCEIQIECDDGALAVRLARAAEAEARRIETKFTRYRDTGVVWQINASNGAPIELDAETAGLIDYAAQLHALSGGLFDVTSGVLRRVWRFDGSDRVPDPAAVSALLPLVGWGRVGWDGGTLTLPRGMEIDLGGIAKEYAVDRAAQVILDTAPLPALVNFGGDLRTTAAKSTGRWKVAIESVDRARPSGGMLEFARTGLATSGDARRYLLRDGMRYSHILDPRSGWPVGDPPRSVTVAARTCLEAGTLATLAMLQGTEADKFLDREGVQYWILR